MRCRRTMTLDGNNSNGHISNIYSRFVINCLKKKKTKREKNSMKQKHKSIHAKIQNTRRQKHARTHPHMIKACQYEIKWWYICEIFELCMHILNTAIFQNCSLYRFPSINPSRTTEWISWILFFSLQNNVFFSSIIVRRCQNTLFVPQFL